MLVAAALPDPDQLHSLPAKPVETSPVSSLLGPPSQVILSNLDPVLLKSNTRRRGCREALSQPISL